MVNFPPVPEEVKPLAHLMKLADEHEERNIVIAYWARMAACILAFKIVPGKKTPETSLLVKSLLDWLEKAKEINNDNEGITSETTAQALIEEYALSLFEHADLLDKSETFNKNTVRTFYSAGMMMDVLDQFGPISDDIREKRKYAKWKAAYIHKCLKAGDIPMSGPPKAPSESASGIVHNSKLSPEELAKYTKYTGPIDLSEPIMSVKPPAPPNITPENLVPFNPPKKFTDTSDVPREVDDISKPPKQLDDDFSHVPTTSPITPIGSLGNVEFPGPDGTNKKVKPEPTSSPDTELFRTPLPPPAHKGEDATSSKIPNPEQIQKAQKLCKFATSALNYDDVENARTYLTQALKLLNMEDAD